MIVYGKSCWNRAHFKYSSFDASNVSPYLNEPFAFPNFQEPFLTESENVVLERHVNIKFSYLALTTS